MIFQTWRVSGLKLEWPEAQLRRSLLPPEAQCSYNFRCLQPPNGCSSCFALYEAEAHRLRGRALPAPPLFTCSKCSHTFNLLEARG